MRSTSILNTGKTDDMKLLIVEDEKPAALRLTKLINEFKPSWNILEVSDSIASSTKWLKANEAPDLIFMDIQLADGLSFEIFNEIEINSPVIFTTAFDQYTLRAFKVNSIDYLLKPIDKSELKSAIEQFENIKQERQGVSQDSIQSILASFKSQCYKERFLVKSGDQFSYINVTDAAYFYAEDGVLFLCTNNCKRHIIDYTVDKLIDQLDPKEYFRINRKVIIKHDSIEKINSYFNSRLKLELKPQSQFDVIVARERVKGFKEWLDS